jgi:hypothetical protein
MMKTIFYMIIVVCLCMVHSLVFGEVIGMIEYIDGDIEITRNGAIIESSDLEEGSEIENYDLIRTYNNSELTIIITSPLSPGTVMDIEPDTVITLEINTQENKKVSTFDMLTGGLALKVKELTQDQDVRVQTESAVMGVRGTSFSVGSSPGGDILVTCEEGEVECVNDEGKSLRAIPGQVVEQRPGELFKQVAVRVSNLKKFRQEWIAERIEAFKPNALRAIKFYAGLYVIQLKKFNRQYTILMKNKDIIEKWTKEEKADKTGSSMEIIKEKKRLIGTLFRLRRILFIFERIYFRLLELKTYHDQGYGHGKIKPGLTTEQFFKAFDKESKELGKKVAQIRFIVKLYTKRNRGGFPVEFGGDTNNDDDFFDDDNF